MGGFAFGVDAVNLLLAEKLGAPPLIARTISISAAIVVTWVLNRAPDLPHLLAALLASNEFYRYVVASLFGAAFNYSAFVIVSHLGVGLGAGRGDRHPHGLGVFILQLGLPRAILSPDKAVDARDRIPAVYLAAPFCGRRDCGCAGAASALGVGAGGGVGGGQVLVAIGVFIEGIELGRGAVSAEEGRGVGIGDGKPGSSLRPFSRRSNAGGS